MSDATDPTVTKETLPAAVMPQELSSFAPQNFEQAIRFCEFMARSDMVPKDYRGKAANIFLAMQYSTRLKMDLLQVMENVTIINGRSCIWGDLMWAICKGSKECVYTNEYLEQNDEVAVCVIKRKGNEELVRRFSVDDAKTARLWGKAGPWTSYPKRMLQMRARGFACRDTFPDLLKGLHSAEEQRDIIDAQSGNPAVMPTGEVVSATDKSPPQDAQNLLDRIRQAASEDELSSLKDACKSAPKDEQEELRVAYKMKLGALRKVPGNRMQGLTREADQTGAGRYHLNGEATKLEALLLDEWKTLQSSDEPL